MKLRILENSVRLRLTQSEVQALGEHGHVEARIRFRPGEYLVYKLEASAGVDHLAVRYGGDHLTVLVPAAQVAPWVETDQVSLEGTQRVDANEVLSILVEKDFQCLHGPAHRRDDDAFPHPEAAEGEA